MIHNQGNVDGNKYVPLFFKTKPEAVMNNARLIEQEGYAALWQTVREGQLPLSLALLTENGMQDLVDSFYSGPESKKFVDYISSLTVFNIPSNLEEYMRRYLYFLYYGIGIAENISAITNTAISLFPDDTTARDVFIKRNKEQYDSMVMQQIANN